MSFANLLPYLVVATEGSQTSTLHPLIVGLYIFFIATFLGFEVINKVPPILHTPLMSGSNAISGITIVGSLFSARFFKFDAAHILGALAVAFAMINVVGGYLVTNRMLGMFQKKA